MIINSPRQLKDWLRNKEKKDGIPANTLINYYMMERLLERIAASRYREMFIIKGGFLIASMIGVDLRSTMDLDTTVKGVVISEQTVRDMMTEIMAIELDDHVIFQLAEIKNIHDEGQYDDFRLTVKAQFFTVRVMLKIDLTTGDLIIPREIEYSFKLMFEDRSISVRAYNLLTILSEKIESVLARNISNTRARDYYDIYTLLKIKKSEIYLPDLLEALQKKTKERETEIYLERYPVYLKQIQESPDLRQIWLAYQKQYAYATGITFSDIITKIWETLDAIYSEFDAKVPIGAD